MSRAATAVLVLSALCARAPMQCGSDPDPAKALEETPGEAVYRLALQFREQGDDEAWAATLAFLIENYPSSRFAQMAKVDLEEAGVARAGSVHDGGDP